MLEFLALASKCLNRTTMRAGRENLAGCRYGIRPGLPNDGIFGTERTVVRFVADANIAITSSRPDSSASFRSICGAQSVLSHVPVQAIDPVYPCHTLCRRLASPAPYRQLGNLASSPRESLHEATHCANPWRSGIAMSLRPFPRLTLQTPRLFARDEL